MDQPQIDALVDAYVKLRDRKAQLKKELDEKTAPITERMAKIEAFLMTQLRTQGVESFRTKAGTAYTSTDTQVSVADKEEFMRFIRANDLWHMLDVKANKTAINQYKEEHEDLPPGINYRQEAVVNVRRS